MQGLTVVYFLCLLKAQALSSASKFEAEIKAEQDERKREEEERKHRRAAFRELKSAFTSDWPANMHSEIAHNLVRFPDQGSAWTELLGSCLKLITALLAFLSWRPSWAPKGTTLAVTMHS